MYKIFRALADDNLSATLMVRCFAKGTEKPLLIQEKNDCILSFLLSLRCFRKIIIFSNQRNTRLAFKM